MAQAQEGRQGAVVPERTRVILPGAAAACVAACSMHRYLAAAGHAAGCHRPVSWRRLAAQAGGVTLASDAF